MDTLAAISIATEPPSTKPENWGLGEVRKPEDKIILPVMWRNVLLQVAYQLLILIVLLYSAPFWFGQGYNLVNTEFGGDADSHKKIQHYTIVFNTFVLMNLFNQVSSRKLSWSSLNIFEEFFINKWFLLVLTAEIGLQWLVVEYFNDIFRTESLDWRMHLTCFCFGLGAMLVNIASKKMPEEKFKAYFEFNFNETNDSSNYNKFLNYADGLSNKANSIKRSQTERMLDSV
jgi:magnesium-transporting ATPase (P-type)